MPSKIKNTDVKIVHFSGNLKDQAHTFFDKIWQLGYCTRDEAYLHLAEWLGVPEQQAHMSTMNGEQCKQVIIFSIQKLNDFRRLDLDFGDPLKHPYYELTTTSKKALKKKERIDVAADRISAAIDNATALLEAEREYASQQAPAMYTREQVEKAVEFGFRQCKLQGYISPSQEQQFIQSLK
mgnify:CR=1 FL=1